MLDVCTTNVTAENTNHCLTWRDQSNKFCHTFYIEDVPKDVVQHKFQFCYQFHGDILSEISDKKHIDSFGFASGKRDVPRRKDWRLSDDGIRDRCTEVCRADWDMEMLDVTLNPQNRGGCFSRADSFHVSHGPYTSSMGHEPSRS